MAATARPTAPRRLLPAALAAWLAFGGAAPAQAPPPAKTYFTNQPGIVIPFDPDGLAQVKQVNLFYSADQGQTWQWHASAQPGEKRFKRFEAPGDGVYWFAVQSIDWQNQPTPA